MQQATDPAGITSLVTLACSQSIPVARLRPMIAHSRALLGEAESEPPFIGRHRVLLAHWHPALAALEALITKVAALESLLEGALFPFQILNAALHLNNVIIIECLQPETFSLVHTASHTCV